MKEDLRLVLQAIKLSFMRDSESGLEIWTNTIHFSFQIGASFLYWSSVVGGLGGVGDWDITGLIVLSSLANIAPLLDIFYLGFRDLPGRVLRGDLDKFLYRPCNPILGMLSENLYMKYPIYQALLAMVALGYVRIVMHFEFQPLRVALSLILLIMGVSIVRFIGGCITLSVFWFGKIDGIRAVSGALESMSRYPVTIYPDSVRMILTYILPYGLSATYPTLILRGWDPPIGFWFVAALLTWVWGRIFAVVWRRALRRYEAYGG